MITNTKRSQKRSIRRFMQIKRYSIQDNILSICVGLALSAFILPGVMTSQASQVDGHQTSIVSDTTANPQTVAEVDDLGNPIIKISSEETPIVEDLVDTAIQVETPYGPAYDPKLQNAAKAVEVEAYGPGVPTAEELAEDASAVAAQEEEDSNYFEQVPFDKDTQKAISDICDSYGVPVEIVYGIMNRESDFNPNACNGRDYGACQIRDVNHKWINKAAGRQLNYMDLLDSAEAACIVYNNEKNNTVGSDNANMILMAYNMGPQTAKKNWRNGNYSSKYSRAVVSYASSLGWEQ